ncbi:MAG TPA: response regulator transcription factor [Terriglobales bacterium]|nr:response regulator transcription factor [Terriglobales bacterium]
MNEKATALVIDDEPQIRKLLRILLEQEQYRVCESESGRHGLSEIALRRPDVVLLDLGLPDIDGMAVLERIRQWSRVPVLVLSVRDGPEDKVAALDAGADDFVTKPFESAELLARLRAIQRRSQAGAAEAIFEAGHLIIDFSAHTVKVKGHEVKVTATEYALLKLLATHAGKVVTHKQLLRDVWGPNAEEQSQYLRVYMMHLRKKIEVAGAERLLRTESGIGYRLVIPAAKD